MALFDNETHFLLFVPKILFKNVFFFETSCSPGGPPSDLQNVKNSPEPPTTVMTPKMTSKPTNLTRDENIQFTATPCIDARGYGTAKSGSCNASRGISAIKSRTSTFPASHTFSASAARVVATRGNPAVDASATARDFVPESGGVAHHGIARLLRSTRFPPTGATHSKRKFSSILAAGDDREFSVLPPKM